MKHKHPFYGRRFAALCMKGVLCLLGPVAVTTTVFSQSCPTNIDFENGTFANWTCYTGNVSVQNGQNVISLTPSFGPVAGQHTMIPAGAGVDPFGGFPTSCPNGSGFSVKLGNNTGGARAEGISYEFTIPANQNNFSLKYHYAVVFQDPNHQPAQQPRLEIEAINVTDNEVIYCSSFAFYAAGGTLLPGFFVSPVEQDTTTVWCKNWSAVSMNLNGQAGKTIRLFFKTADCTFQRHFGYAYVDVDSECSSEFTGAIYCPGDTTVNLTAPFGYQNYTWFTNNFTQIIGTAQTINLTPPPPSGTTIAVEVVPYNGYGCLDTFFAVLYDTLRIIPNAGADGLSCNQFPVQLGGPPKPGVVYQWNPPDDLSSPFIANPRASPPVTREYILKVHNYAGGCLGYDTVVVTASYVDTTLTFIGKDAFCITSNDSAVLQVNPTLRIQWHRNNAPLTGATGTRYRVSQTGDYYAVLENDKGCVVQTAVKPVLIETPVPGIRYPVLNAVRGVPMPMQARNFGVTAQWAPPLFLDNPQIFNPGFRGVADQLYTVDIITRAGCKTVDTQFVRVFPEINFYVPTAFTPNKDGLNDYLLPVATGIIEVRFFRVYNRWGQLLYQLSAGSPGWDGTFKGVAQSMQTVVWVAEGLGADKEVHRQKGTCVLIR